MQVLGSLLYFVSDRNQLIEYDLIELKLALSIEKYYKGRIMGISVTDFAVMNTGQVCTLSENGILENAISGKSK